MRLIGTCGAVDPADLDPEEVTTPPDTLSCVTRVSAGTGPGVSSKAIYVPGLGQRLGQVLIIGGLSLFNLLIAIGAESTGERGFFLAVSGFLAASSARAWWTGRIYLSEGGGGLRMTYQFRTIHRDLSKVVAFDTVMRRFPVRSVPALRINYGDDTAEIVAIVGSKPHSGRSDIDPTVDLLNRLVSAT